MAFVLLIGQFEIHLDPIGHVPMNPLIGHFQAEHVQDAEAPPQIPVQDDEAPQQIPVEDAEAPPHAQEEHAPPADVPTAVQFPKLTTKAELDEVLKAASSRGKMARAALVGFLQNQKGLKRSVARSMAVEILTSLMIENPSKGLSDISSLSAKKMLSFSEAL